jgi:amino acid adenylation domain-containing protein
MRASVNSFGFGGTNAHAIIESLPPPPPPAQVPDVPGGVVGPLLFSANSGSSLLRNVQRHLAHLQKNADIDLRDLNWVLQTRRSTHRVRAAFAGASRQDILDSMAKFVASHANAAKGEIGSVPRLVNPKEAPGTLGIFTGQGAQWAAMGRELLRKSPLFRRSLEACEAVLKNDLLPGHAPEWSLVDELVKDAPESRISEAALSQPLCTAVQIGLVDMLAACGIKLDAAVGHSSGEIAATYATGIINLKAAMQISFYRGFYAHLARGAQGQKGGMIAVGLSMEAASQFCRQPSFEGRLTVAASNGPQSCTLSGDLDAVVEAKKQLDLDNTFARQLQVDTAYHSHHMHACSDQYLQSLLACDIKVTPPKPGGCVWNSSVRGDTRLLKPSGDLTSLRGPYWVANMVQTVKFSQAVESSIWHGGPYDVAIEVGPHPALKGPTEQTLKAAYGAVPRYSGLLKRNNSDIEAFQAAVGQVWAQLGPSHVDFAGYRNSFYEESTTSPPTVPRIPKDLPPYSWDHDQVFWRESRSSMRFRTGRDRGHELLGRRVPDDNDREMRWRNVLRLGEMPWLRGHEVLQEVLLPAAAYVSIAAQAAQSLVAAGAGAGASGRPTIRQLSVEDIDILRPVVVPDKNGVETLFTVQVLTETGSDKARGVIRANFSYYVCQNESTGAMIHTCSGALAIQLGEASGTVLPPREPVPDNIVHIESQPIYDMFRGVGLNYTGAFNAITESHRCLDYAAATGVWPSKSLDAQYILHPAVLDVAFQSLFIAHTHPSSQKLKSALLPSHINRVVVDPGVAVLHDNEATACNFDAWVVSATGTKLDGDINVYDVKSGQAFVQVEGLSTRSAGGQDASTDKRVFLKTVHSHDASVGLVLPPRDPLVDARALQANVTIERLALFYMRRVLAEVRPEERNTLQPRYQQMLKAFDDHVLAVRQGNVKLLGSSGWVADDEQQEVLATLIQQHPDPDCVELKLVQAVGGALTQVVRGQMQQQEVISQDGDLLKQYSPSASVATDHAIAQLLKQITFKFPRCSILEIGAGTGSTAWSILSAVDNLYDSYTYTDASSSDFSNAAAKLSGFERIVYKKLDIEEDVHAQGFSLNSYDVIIASNVLSATHDLESTLRNTRELLRPGGYLLLSEITAHDSIISRFLSTSLSGLVPRGDDQTGRTISPGEWHRNLRRAGFSGIDTIFYDNGDETKHITSCSVSRANDDNVLRLLKPLAFFSELPAPTTPLLVIGGRCLGSSKVIDEIDEILPLTWRPQVRAVPSIDGLQDSHLTPGMDVLCLHDIDEPLFARLPMKADRLTKLQQLLISAKNLLWVTTGTPRAGMIRGISRVAAMELPHLKMQVLGLEPGLTPALGAQHCVESLLRLRHMDQLKEHDKSDLVLWAIEPESEMLASGVVRIPRVMPDTDLDQRYNAKTRTIVRTTDATNVAVRAAVANGSSRMVLQAVGTGLLDRNKSGDLVQVQAQYSLHIPCQQGQPLYLMCGQEERGGAVIAISHTNSSSLLLNPKDVAALESSFCVPGCLEALADHFLRRSLITRASATNARTLLLLDPEMELATQLEAELGDIGKTLYCVSSRPGRDIPQNWTRVHPNMSRRMAKHLVPQDIDLFADCSDPAHETPGSEQLKACLPPSCQMWRLDSELLRELLKTDAPLTIPSPSEMKSLDEISQPRCDIIAAANLPGADSFNLSRIRYITDWRQREALPLTVQPLDPLGLLRPDRTYMIVGGSGGLGLSISKWMIDHGAKHIVITSRSAKLDTGLQQHARRAGASVYAMAMDVTRRDQVIGVVNTVRRTMPPIAGVCNFSMVLHDKLFLDMTAQELNGTLDAKVVGTEILSDIFSDASESPLDFFILTSSTASTVGNIGQANYHAANLFMAAIVESRRSRGLAASVVHIGWVADTGYVTRSDRYRLLEDHFRSMRFIPLSETDVQDAFGQAIRAGKPRPHSEEEASLGSHDITMGLEPATQPMQSSQKSKALWVSNPQLMSLEPYSVLSSSEQQLPGHGSGSNVREKVYNAKTENEATAVVVAAFATKLENILQLPADSVQEDLERPIIDLGIDSLVAVEIRTWFLKELDTEVPVVKILGGDTVLQISVQATKKILADRMEAKANEPAPAAGKVTEVKKPQQLATPAPAPAPAPNPVVSRPVPAAHTPVSPALTSAGVLPNSLPSNSSYFNAKNSTRLGDMSGVSTPFSAATPLSGSRTPESTITSATGSVYGGDLSSEKSGCEEENGNGTDREIVDKKGKDAPVVVVREAPMSAAQSRIWFVSKHLEDPAAYNTAFHYRVQGPVSMARLRRALQLVVNNHDCLRTCFFSRLEDAHPMQGVMATSAFELTHIDGADDTTLQETLTRFKTRVWDLEKGETMAIAVLGRSATQNDIVLGYHHILMDGWSLALFLRDLDRAYRLQPLDNLDGVSYVDYSIHQSAEESTGVLDDHLAFWQAEFETLPETLPLLPMARGLDRSALLNSEPHKDSGSHYLDRELSPARIATQQEMCKRLRISPFHLHLALFQVLLARMANIEDVCIGVVDANRRDERFTQTVGCFVNMLPLRSSVSSRSTFAEVAVGASRKAMEVFARGGVPFDRILDQTKVPRAAGTNPLFQAAINYRAAVGGMDMWNLPLGDECRMQLSTREAKEAENPYDVSLGFIETQGGGCLVQLFCLADLYSQDASRMLLDTYLGLLDAVSRDPQVSVGDLLLHDAAQVSHALQLGKGPEMDFGWPATLSRRVQDISALYPTQKAITDASGELSYAQMAARVNQVAKEIAIAGGSGKRVAVLCEPSIDGVVSMLAVLHVGGVYVPLDTSLPTSRHEAIVRECEPAVMLCHLQTEQRVKELLQSFPAILPVRVHSLDNDHDIESVPLAAEPESPAVLLFTSGSTGTPKGIILTQANFVNHVALKTHQMGLQQECVLQQSSLGFDMSLIQIFSALANAGRLVIAQGDIRRDPVELSKLMQREGVSFTIATPTEYLVWINSAGEVLRRNDAWRFAFSGGEQIPRQLKTDMNRLGLPHLCLTNCYGPTEITAAATFQCIPLEDDTNSCLSAGGTWSQYAVGKALPNYSVCIVDAAGHPVPVGYTGEICIGGSGIALGYLNHPDQTTAKFVTDITAGRPNSRGVMYKTGDKGRLLSDGTLLCLGRLDGDTQIKLRGQRIELQEVESALIRASEGALASAVVTLRGHVLVAHATLSSADTTLDESDLARVLARTKLPQAFIPASISILDTMPTTSNGKVDRKAIAALPLPGVKDGQGVPETTEKMTVREGELRLLWERVLPTLGDKRLGPSSDFFLCGGNSLSLMKLQKAIRETTGVAVSTKQLYEATTLRAMTHCVFDRTSASGGQDEKVIDWAAEAAVPAWLQDQIRQLQSQGLFETQADSRDIPSEGEGIQVLLTGATSFLGGHLLNSLLQSPSVSKVHCIAVPGDEQAKLPQHAKVASYTGSLLSPTLGLTPAEHKTLEQNVNVVVHAGANGHCLNHFDSLRTPNLHSLHTLASLALRRSVPILFLSSSRAVLLSGNPSPRPGSLRGFSPAADGSDGYTASKWAGEVFLENLVAELRQATTASSSLTVAVHRPCTLASENAPNSDAMNGVLRYSLAMRCAPRLKRAEGYLDFGPLDVIIGQMTAAVLELALPTSELLRRRGAEIHFRHHSGGIKSPMSEFRAHLEKVYGGKFDEADMEDWLVRAGKLGLDPLITAYIEALLESGRPLISPYMGEV